MNKPLVTVITATTGNPLLGNNLRSVLNQTYDKIQHLVMIDGQTQWELANETLDQMMNPNLDVIELPYSTGKDRFNGHRIYGAGTYLADGEYLMFLDDDNALEPNHIERCIEVINRGNVWAYSLRKIVDKQHNFICNDDCESLGKWHSVIDPRDHFVDVNCYFLRKDLALAMSPVWYRKFREPGQMEIDRAMYHVLNQMCQQFDCTKDYTVKYAVGNTALSVNADFFLQGNEKMLQHYNGKLPWRQE
jgi:glycosyltransferase involved in cell wall biosynthesis